MKQKKNCNNFAPVKWDDDVPQKGFGFTENVIEINHKKAKHKGVTITKQSLKKGPLFSKDHFASPEAMKEKPSSKIKSKSGKINNLEAGKLKSKICKDNVKLNLNIKKEIDSSKSNVKHYRVKNSHKLNSEEIEIEKPQLKSALNSISQYSSTINSNMMNLSKRKRRQINKLKKLEELNKGEMESQNDNTEISELSNNKSKPANNLNKPKCLLKKSERNDNESLRDKLLEKLKGSRFRYLNEQMYTSRGSEALKMFQADPDSFIAYHEGYRHQAEKWPLNPLDTIIQDIRRMPFTYEIADFGCGDARLSKSVPHTVHSFDLVSLTGEVKACDMANVPLKTSSIDVAVYCLSLMGVNIKDYLLEANRVLKMGGTLKIAEVSSRFIDAHDFIKDVAKFGFKLMNKNFSNEMFYFINFKKIGDPNKSNLPKIALKSCLYKKR